MIPLPPDYSANEVAWIRQQCARHSYKGGWRIHVPFYATYVHFTFTAVDSRNPRAMVKVSSRRFVPQVITWERNEEQFTRWLADRIVEMEVHEAREWLKRDGEIWDDPHKPKPPPAFDFLKDTYLFQGDM